MSVIIKSNQLNVIIYKYLLQAGLNHTAFTLFNQAKLQSSLQQFKFDIKSGHLTMLLQKSLLFTQMESHVNFGQHQQCLQPFYLLKSHTCKITQKAKQDQSNFLKQLNNNIIQCIKRTNNIYNTELTNKNYQEIVYEPRGMNYFDKFEKLKVIDSQLIDNQGENNKQKIVKIDGQKDNTMAIWNRLQNVIYLTQSDGFQQTIINQVFPCTLNGQIQPLQLFKLTSNNLIMVFNQSRVKIVNRETTQSVQFTVPLTQFILSIQVNPNFSNLISFQTKTQYFLLNTKNMEQISTGKGILKWRSYDQYIIYQSGSLSLKSLIKPQTLISYAPLNIDNNLLILDELQISSNRTFFFVTSYKRNKIWVYTFQKQQPLYIFNFQDYQQSIKKIIWTHRNQVDYLCILTDIALRVWEVQLNSYCLKIDLQKYQLGQVSTICSLQKNQTQTFLLILGDNNLLVSDIANLKIQRIQTPLNADQMCNVGKNSVMISTDQNLYFLDGQKLTQLFK